LIRHGVSLRRLATGSLARIRELQSTAAQH